MKLNARSQLLEGTKISDEDVNIYTGSKQRAFIVKISGTVAKMLQADEVMIGYSKAEGLIDASITKQEFRDIIQKQYFAMKDSKRSAGQIAGDLWRFIREMGLDHYVLVPAEEGFYIGKVAGPATYDEMKIFNDTAYRRKITWLNDKKPISYDMATDELRKKTKSVQRVVDTSELFIEIEFALRHAS